MMAVICAPFTSSSSLSSGKDSSSGAGAGAGVSSSSAARSAGEPRRCVARKNEPEGARLAGAHETRALAEARWGARAPAATTAVRETAKDMLRARAGAARLDSDRRAACWRTRIDVGTGHTVWPKFATCAGQRRCRGFLCSGKKVSEPASGSHTVPRAHAARTRARVSSSRSASRAKASAPRSRSRVRPRAADPPRRGNAPPTRLFAARWLGARDAMADGNDRNWNALLKWSLAQTDDGNTANVRDGDGAAAPRVISEADRAWFLQAMQNGMVDEIKRMKAIAAAIGPDADAVLPSQEDIDARLELMHELNDRVCSVDNGGDLHTIGGLVPVVMNLSSPHAPLRAAAAEIVGTTVQNHLKAQLAAVECGAVAPLLRLVQGEGGDAEPSGDGGDGGDARDGNGSGVGFESEDSGRKAARLAECRVKALLGLSSLTRGCPRAVAEFFKLGGAKSVARCVEETTSFDTKDDDESLRRLTLKTKTKALHLARHLCTMSDKTMSIIVDADFVTSAASALAESVPSFGALGTSWSDAFRSREKQSMSTDAILGSQLREASLRLLLDIARCVDFAKEPKALDQLRGERVVDAVNVVGRWYSTFDADEKSTFQDAMTVCAELAKMFG